jgi:two-component system, cell cycle sensor histidine kinase and response regulator CckA
MTDVLRVLLAEDKATDADLVVRELRRAGFEPEWRRVDTEADYLAALTPDLDIILSDYEMGQFDAPNALRLLRERRFDIPFIIVSGTIGEETAVAAMKEGASDYLLKDRLTRLGPAVRRALDQRTERRERGRAEVELKRFVSANPVVIYALAVKDGVLEYVWTSDNIKRLTGHDVQDARGMGWWAANIHPDEREHVLALHAPPYVLDDLLLEYRFQRKDGSWFWVRDEKRLLRDAAGQPTEVVGSWVDITESKQTEAALAESEARLRLAMDAAAMGHWELDLATGRVIGSPNHFALFGLHPDEASSTFETWRGLVHPEDLDRVLEAMEIGRRGRTTVASEYRIRRADDRRINWLSVTGRFLYDAHGEAVRFIGVVFDVTERRQTEDLRAMQHAVTAVLADSRSVSAAAPGIIEAVCAIVGGDFGALWEIDRQGQQLRCADLWRRPGLPAAELEAQTRSITFAPGFGLLGRVWASRAPIAVADLRRDPDFLRADLAAAAGLRGAFGFPILLRGEVLGVLDFLGRHKLDPEPELLARLSAIGSQIGQFIEHRRAEEQLLQAQKMEAVGQLAGGIAHDFNNLLGVILGYAQLAARELGPEHKANRRIDAVCKAAERAAALTRQILTFSRQQVVETRVCDLNHVVEDIEKMLRRLIGEDLQLDVSLGGGLGRVRADPGQLEQVIMNLAVNARDAMPKGGRLVIETANVDLDETYARSHPEVRPGRYVMLAIGDTGEGMDAKTLARIFEPFFTTKGPGRGTGLGLAVVFGIVKQSFGFVSVYSEPGRGSTFKVYLPRVEDQESTLPAISREGPKGGSETVLVLEDEDALRGIVVEILREAGYTVLEATQPAAAAAIAAHSSQAIHLLLTDVVLPGQSGPETAIQLRDACPGMRVLLMSGYTDRLVGGQRSAGVALPFLSKPFTIDALLRKVREVLDQEGPV